jgi:Na+/proline symporter
VLYLFLVADLVCAAAVVPVFGGLLSSRLTNRAALWGLTAGLAAGAWLFPAPGAATPTLLPAFAAALLVPALVAVPLALLSSEADFDHATLRQSVTPLDDGP